MLPLPGPLAGSLSLLLRGPWRTISCRCWRAGTLDLTITTVCLQRRSGMWTTMKCFCQSVRVILTTFGWYEGEGDIGSSPSTFRCRAQPGKEAVCEFGLEKCGSAG